MNLIWYNRTIEVYPGPYEVVRSVKIKTAYGEKIRPVLKLSKVSVVNYNHIQWTNSRHFSTQLP